ncbi:MAG: PfkB family carbohydrate kinase, partial [Roseibium sp.]
KAVDEVVDLTGAGDLFASGFLFGLARDYDLKSATELGCLCASNVIGHVGARPEKPLKAIAEQGGFEV